MLIRRLLLAALVVGLTGSWARGASHVEATILADTSAVAGDKPFMVGVMLKIDPGWHVYWKNPGDAGLATKVIWNLPEGYSAGELEYPTPHRFVLPGDIVCYGYENTVMLLTKVTRRGAAGPVRISGKVSWLVCADVCIPGSQELEMSLPIASLPAGNNEDLFKGWKDQIPTEVDESADVASCTAGTVAQSDKNMRAFGLDVVWKKATPGEVTFFPGVLDGYSVENMNVQNGASKTRITFDLRPLAGQHDLATVLNGVVGYNAGSGRRGVNVAISIP